MCNWNLLEVSKILLICPNLLLFWPFYATPQAHNISTISWWWGKSNFQNFFQNWIFATNGFNSTKLTQHMSGLMVICLQYYLKNFQSCSTVKKLSSQISEFSLSCQLSQNCICYDYKLIDCLVTKFPWRTLGSK